MNDRSNPVPPARRHESWDCFARWARNDIGLFWTYIGGSKRAVTVKDHTYCIYIMTNDRRTVIYTGVSGQLKARVYQHRTGAIPGFTHTYNAKRLVYYEMTSDVYSAIAREKQIKAGSRAKKIALIESMNPNWEDLYDSI
jgi:putative endonuclease